MYDINVQRGWEMESHTQTAVNNFLGIHRCDATFQIMVGGWTKEKRLIRSDMQPTDGRQQTESVYPHYSRYNSEAGQSTADVKLRLERINSDDPNTRN